jgi:Fur family ferric uptake transcriptional regulator
MTGQRRLVIELLEHTDGHLDVQTLYRLAHAQDSSISIATIYRTLGVLERARLVQQRFHSRDHEHRYFERLPAQPEYYFTCRGCRKIFPFRSDLVPELEQRLAARQVRSDSLPASRWRWHSACRLADRAAARSGASQ